VQSLQPEQALFLLQNALPVLKQEHRITKAVIEAIPHQNGDYRPDPASKTALELAWHIVASEHRFLGGVVAGAFDFTPFPRPESVKDSADMARLYEEIIQKHIEGLEKLSGEQLVKVLDFRGVFQLPAAAYVGFTMHHSIHHRGQLSTYLRPMGAKVPAMYGESHDSALAKAAKS